MAQIVKQVPRLPNNRTSLDQLQQKSLSDLLVIYLNWAGRYVPPRVRRVVVEPTLTADPRWKTHAPSVNHLLQKVRAGEDLAPNLSSKVERHGFTESGGLGGRSQSKWEDKDFLLITMGYHHFHLGAQAQADQVERTGAVLFAQLTRETFHALGLFDHSVFDVGASMSAERERMWQMYDRRVSFGRPPGVFFSANPITSSGHSLRDVQMAMDYARVIRFIDPQLDTLARRSALFNDMPIEQVKAMKLDWHFSYQDLGLVDRAGNVFHVVRQGSL